MNNKKSGIRNAARGLALLIILSLLLSLGQPGFGRGLGGPNTQTVPLFTYTGAEYPGYNRLAPQAVRYRFVEINPRVFQDGGLGIGDRVLFASFGAQVLAAVIDRIQTDVNGVLSFRGRVEGTEGGWLMLSAADGCVLGALVVPEWGRKYAVNSIPALGWHIVQDLDLEAARELDDGPPLIPPAVDLRQADRSAGEGTGAAAADTTVDLMIVYTPAARNWAVGSGGINLVISEAVQWSQLAFDNSNTGIQLRLVYSGQVNYQESGNFYTDLNRLTGTTDGYMDEVHAWRNQVGADMVDLFEDIEDVGGVAWLLLLPSGQPDYAFSLIRVKQAMPGYTLAHELGHNFGCHHRKDQSDEPGPGIYSYSAGWRWIGTNGFRYCSVMSYQDAWSGISPNRVGYFSSPLIQYQGAATGDAADGDNARTLRELKNVVAGYRSGTQSDYWLTINATTGGTTVPSPGSYSYQSGSVVLVQAVPYTHYLFNNWSGHASGSANPVSVTVNSNKSVTANFLRIIYSPSFASGREVLNRSLSQAEYIHILTWKANPDNENIQGYRIYRLDGGQKTMLTNVQADVFEYQNRRVDKDKEYIYWITAVDTSWREGDPAIVVIK
jgi:hypothetical protein